MKVRMLKGRIDPDHTLEDATLMLKGSPVNGQPLERSVIIFASQPRAGFTTPAFAFHIIRGDFEIAWATEEEKSRLPEFLAEGGAGPMPGRREPKGD
jgi:hypothetical protein